jgi:hypothetical protein
VELGSVSRAQPIILFGVRDLEFDFDVFAFDSYGVAGHTSWRRQAQYAPGRHVESGTVPGAGDFHPHNNTFGERSAPMGAGVVDRVVGSLDVEERNASRSDFHRLGLPWSDVAGFGDFQPLGHGAPPLVSAYARRLRAEGPRSVWRSGAGFYDWGFGGSDSSSEDVYHRLKQELGVDRVEWVAV